jgi:transposase-like protein|tara:strand:+ start:1491 stop:1733 length:243 start_codon:yes stop_codon:yes gene_type:complete
MNGTGIAGAQDYVPTDKGEWRCATCGKTFYEEASALAWGSPNGLQQQCKQCYNERNTYTQREWDRTVGYGEVPDEYKENK